MTYQREDETPAPLWLWLLLFGLVIVGTAGGAVEAHRMKTRGLRNNNPGNLRKSADKWQGMAPTQPDSDFVTFTAPEWGIRALAKVLKTYAGQGHVTVRQIISRWAPPSENNTAAYIASVAAHAGLDPDVPVSLASHLPKVVEAIIKHENGSQPYPAALIAKGIGLA